LYEEIKSTLPNKEMSHKSNTLVLQLTALEKSGTKRLIFGGFVDKGLVNVRDDSTSSNGSLDQCVKLLISPNSKLQMPGCDSFPASSSTSAVRYSRIEAK